MTLKVQIEMPVLSLIEVEFGHLPTFLGNEWTSEMQIGSFGVVSKIFFNEALFPDWSFFCGMEGNGLSGMIIGLLSEAGSKADLTLKVQIEMPVLSLIEVEFGHLPTFLGNEWTSEMQIGSFGVVSKIFFNEALFPDWSFFCGMEGNGLRKSV
ncbi:hypothetical protein [Mesonia sp.]|uniref:hypothetical protein n=1 Tax=Mesonia sp. TaxID=1960830 RepID=UPI003F961C4D